jgi:hypothetical protein
MKTTYEWDIETVDKFGDILDHDHRDTLAEFAPDVLRDALLQRRQRGGNFTRLVLVRSVWTEASGLVDRTWAYVSDVGAPNAGVLPTHCKDAFNRTATRVPARFARELEKVAA